MAEITTLAVQFDEENIPRVNSIKVDPADYRSLNRAIHADCGEIVPVSINGKEYTLWCDEESKLKDGWLSRATFPLFDYNNNLADLVSGGYVILDVTFDEEGNENYSEIVGEDAEILKNAIIDRISMAQVAVMMM